MDIEMGSFIRRHIRSSRQLRCLLFLVVLILPGLVLPSLGWATQQHSHSEGIIVHQAGHLFFLFSMLVLIFTVTSKGLNQQKGWRMIQWSAFFFILWNLDAIAAHFLDNQLEIVKIIPGSVMKMELETHSNSMLLAGVYYILKLDHLLCVPAMLLLYLGLSKMVQEQKDRQKKGAS